MRARVRAAPGAATARPARARALLLAAVRQTARSNTLFCDEASLSLSPQRTMHVCVRAAAAACSALPTFRWLPQHEAPPHTPLHARHARCSACHVTPASAAARPPAAASVAGAAPPAPTHSGCAATRRRSPPAQRRHGSSARARAAGRQPQHQRPAAPRPAAAPPLGPVWRVVPSAHHHHHAAPRAARPPATALTLCRLIITRPAPSFRGVQASGQVGCVCKH
jgi:hypothetical protein